jgi:hypothetical protein
MNTLWYRNDEHEQSSDISTSCSNWAIPENFFQRWQLDKISVLSGCRWSHSRMLQDRDGEQIRLIPYMVKGATQVQLVDHSRQCQGILTSFLETGHIVCGLLQTGAAKGLFFFWPARTVRGPGRIQSINNQHLIPEPHGPNPPRTGNVLRILSTSRTAIRV